MSPLSGLRQAAAVSALNLASLPSRWTSSLVAVTGIAGVVLVTVGILSVARGFAEAMQEKSRPDVAMVLRASATGELDSSFSNDQVQAIEAAPNVAREGGTALVSPEVFVIVDVPRKSTGTSSNVPLRGVSPTALAVRGNVSVAEGRMFTPGLNEVVVGRGAQTSFAGLELGKTLKWGTREWQVVGLLDADGGVPESEIWADARVVQDSYRRGNSYSTVRVRLTAPGAFDEFKDALTSDPRLSVTVRPEREFYAEQSRMFSVLVTSIGIFVGVLMGLGAVFGAVNTMYNAVASRIREIATLRALGYGAVPVVASVLFEALILGLVGGVIGAALAYLIFNGFVVSTLNFASFSQVSFGFAVTPGLLVAGVVIALLLGFLGGVLPGIRAARIPITEALREL